MHDRLLGIATLLLAAGMAWAARDMVPPFSYEPVGPRAFPWLLAGLMAVFGFVLLLRPSTTVAEQPEPEPDAQSRHVFWPVVLALAIILIYALIFQPLGFPLATCALGIALGRLFGASWKQALVTGLVLGIGLFVLFDRLLDVVLPLGVLRSVL